MFIAQTSYQIELMFCYSRQRSKQVKITTKLTGGKSEKGIAFEMMTLFNQ